MDQTRKHGHQYRIAVSPAEAAQMLGLGRTKFYELLANKEISSVKIGTRRLVRVAELEDWLKAREAPEA